MGAFADNSYLKMVVLPESLENLGMFAFTNCDNLTSIHIPEKVKSQKSEIPDSEYYHYPRFWGCRSLKKITVSEKNTDFSSDGVALFNKDKTKIYEVPNGIEGDYTIPDTVTEISATFENCVNLKSITIPSSIQILPNSCFKNCVSLESCTLPSNMQDLGWGTFYNCVSLKNVNIPNGVLSIPNSAFYHCTSLTNITLPDSVKSIGSSAFTGCYNLTGITFPNKLESIGDNAFWKCKSLSNVTLPESLLNIDAWAFQACDSLGNLNIPKNVSNIGTGAFSEINGITITVDENNSNFTSVDNVIFTKDMKKLVAFCNTEKKDYAVPEGVEEISSYAFWNSNIKKISFPKSLKTIRTAAFLKCNSLSEVTLPGIETLEKIAFGSCSDLKKVTLSESISNLDTLAFEKSYQLEAININGNNGELISKDGVVYTKDMEYIAVYPSGKKGDYLIPDSVVGGLSQKDLSISYDENSYWNSTFGAVFDGAAGLTAFKVNSTNEHFTVENGVLFAPESTYGVDDSGNQITKTVTKLVAYPAGKQGEYTIPSNVEICDPTAFFGCLGLTKISIPETVKKIGNYEEYSNPQMGIPQWYIPFYLCSNLQEITVSDKNPNYSSYDGALYNKEQTNLLDFPDAKQSITFPMSMETSWGGICMQNAFSDMTGEKDFYFPNRYSIISDSLLQSADKDLDVTVHGYKGSTAEMFAIVNDLKFVDMEYPGQKPGEDPGEKPGEDPGQKPGEDPGQKPGEDPGEKPSVTAKVGDLDGDDELTSVDSLYILRESVGLENFTPEQVKLCDVDGDKSVTSADALEVLRFSVGFPSEYLK